MKRKAKVNGKKRPYNKLDLEKFIRVWQKAKNIKEALERFGVYDSTIDMSATAARLRRSGVKLKKHPRGGYRTDYAALAKLANKVRQ